MFFFFNDTATTEIYTLSLHDALPICALLVGGGAVLVGRDVRRSGGVQPRFFGFMLTESVLYALVFGVVAADRKSTRLNSSHANISYAVFCLKKKNIH